MAQSGARRPPAPLTQQPPQAASSDQQQQQTRNSAPLSSTHQQQQHLQHLHHSHPHHQHQHSSLPSTPYRSGKGHAAAQAGGGPAPSASSSASKAAEGSGAAGGGAKSNSFRGHQRRQSVARLLPDISKLRLLSWLVEASNELINCDIAIMDGVYAKLNRSRESLLFWQQQHHHQGQSGGPSAALAAGRPAVPPPRPPPPAVGPVATKSVISRQRVSLSGSGGGGAGPSKPTAAAPARANKQAGQPSRPAGKQAPRNHHSLPMANYDASSLAALSVRSSLTVPASGSHRRQRVGELGAQATANQHLFQCDSNNQSDDDDNSSAASSTTSSGIQSSSSSSSSSGSSSASTAGSDSASSASSSSGDSFEAAAAAAGGAVGQAAAPPAQQQASPAEQLSERIRRAVMEHNYLQNLLVNVIRQHDRQRGLIEQQRRHQALLARQQGQRQERPEPAPRIDLADIADALDDGCQCACHSSAAAAESASRHNSISSACFASATLSPAASKQQAQLVAAGQHRASTLPTSSSLGLLPAAGGPAGRLAVPGRKNRRKKHTDEPSREQVLARLADKLCENCLETHYWLHSCSALEPGAPVAGESGAVPPAGESPAGPSGPQQQQKPDAGASPAATAALTSRGELDAGAISLRNATFIKLVQQQVRSTISNSIELIDLIRREIKSPESIKQKQLMRCFSASIQLLSSVAAYVVPSQDISTFINADLSAASSSSSSARFDGGAFSGHSRFHGAQQQQQQPTTLFNLPPSDFDHLLLFPSAFYQSQTNQQQQQFPYASTPGHAKTNYHLAQAPEIPIRRRLNFGASRQRRSSDETHGGGGSQTTLLGNNEASAAALRTHTNSPDASFRSLPPNASPGDTKSFTTTTSDTKKSASLQRGEPGGETTPSASMNPAGATSGPESSSGASSNNSSASSSIARNQLQQQHQAHPSLTKAHTSGAILDGKTRHDLSFEAMANLSHHHQQAEDDDLTGFHLGGGGSGGRPGKFWQSSRFNFIKKLLQVKQQRLLRQQSKDRRIYNNKVANKFRLVMMDLTHFNRSQQLLTTENGVNSLLTSMRNVLEFGLYLTVKLY